MKIAIIGYGKMGHAIERIALERGHQIVSVIDADNTAEFDSDAFASADAAIEFTTPSTAPVNIARSAERGVPVVCGSTGWADRRAEVEEAVLNAGSALIASSNFSIGVHVFNSISRRLARIMDKLEQYEPSMTETHHIHKLDHPSGTAITIADGILEECPRIKCWAETGVVWKNAPEQEREAQMAAAETRAGELGDDKLGILTYRDGEVPGIHKVKWESAVDTITIEHSAKSRDGFALGAVIAAEWIAHRKGIFTIDRMMEDIL
ncbi:MAG: 4-hydroxy-tetrahydrodipicolinate reductase [Duncaniella sp.]|nr:4-hydroxy-tetrahydrodipicolinate reductase [Duncaniella sp.]MDE5692867.1 4-hydroxy-tetrahydrodipicolinate reductase [Duncaniella sp.]